MTIRYRTPVRSRLAVAGLLAASTALSACSTVNTTPRPTAAQPSTIATPSLSAAPTRVTESAATTLSLRSAEAVPCYAGASDAGCVQPGMYALDASIPPGTATLDVPAGWFEWDPGGNTEGLLVDSGPDAPDGSGWGLLLSALGTIPRDPCGVIRGSIPADQASTVDGVMGAMVGWPGFRASAPPHSIRIDGVEGRTVELTFTGDAVHCASSTLWTTPSGMAVDAYPLVDKATPRPAQLSVFQFGDRMLIIRTTDDPRPSPFEVSQGVKNDPTRHAADQLALRSIVSSIRFAPAGG